MFSVKFIGMSALASKASKMSSKLAKNISAGIKEAAFIIEREAKLALTTGDTRAILTGRLRSDTIVRTLTPVSATIAPLVKYAIYVHEGTSRMAPRPFMKKAIEESQGDIERLFVGKVKSAISLN